MNGVIFRVFDRKTDPQREIRQITSILIKQLPSLQWTGSVVMNKEGTIYVNRGQREGIAVGQKFIVGEVEVIRDPDTGEVLDEDMTEIATLEVNKVKEKLSYCSVVAGDAAAVEKGMTVHVP